MSKISVYGGTGFIGGTFCNIFADKVIKVLRDERLPFSKDILYFISTTTNYNVFDSLTLDINTNLNILMEVLSHCKNSGITFNYVSSGFVYGNDIIDAKETDIPDPRGFYSITKRAAVIAEMLKGERPANQTEAIKLSNEIQRLVELTTNIVGIIVCTNSLTNFNLILSEEGFEDDDSSLVDSSDGVVVLESYS